MDRSLLDRIRGVKPTSQRKSTKVFGIGFHKTGTSSLGEALTELGYRVCGPFGIHESNLADVLPRRAVELAAEYDAVEDNPWPVLYRDLDRAYPGSKFILTVRAPQRWLDSVVRHFGTVDTPMREWIYGVGHPLGNEERYREVYENHNQAVRAYFRNDPERLLVMDFEQGESWEKLCGFLGVPEPDSPFPHANRGARQRAVWVRGLKSLRRWTRRWI